MFRKRQLYIFIFILLILSGSCAAHKYKNHKKPCDCLNVKDNPRATKHK